MRAQGCRPGPPVRRMKLDEEDDRGAGIERPLSIRALGGWKTKSLCSSWFVGFAGGCSTFAFRTFAGRRIAPDVVRRVGHARGGQPMRATSRVTRDGSITVIKIGPGDAGARSATARA